MPAVNDPDDAFVVPGPGGAPGAGSSNGPQLNLPDWARRKDLEDWQKGWDEGWKAMRPGDTPPPAPPIPPREQMPPMMRPPPAKRISTYGSSPAAARSPIEQQKRAIEQAVKRKGWPGVIWLQ